MFGLRGNLRRSFVCAHVHVECSAAIVYLLLLSFALSGCAKNRKVAQVPAAPPASGSLPGQLAPPILLSPPANAAFHAYPRTLTLAWSPVQGAVRYGVEIDCWGCCAERAFCREVGKLYLIDSTDKTSYTFDFVGDQPGRWRVWAIAQDTTAGPTSEWRIFTYGKVIDDNIFPPARTVVSPVTSVGSPARLAAPTLLSPPPNAAFHEFPRTLNLKWSPVPGASSYGVEIDCYGCCASHDFCQDVGRPFVIKNTTDTTYTFDFVGDQPGRWRVWAVALNGVPGPKSEWRVFTYGRIVAGNIFPIQIPADAQFPPASCRPGFDGEVELPPGTTRPHAIYNPDPEYTDAARKSKVSGSVLLSVSVGADGLVGEVCVLQSLRPDLDANAVNAVRIWRFDPARNGNVTIPAQIKIEINYRLR